MHIIIISVWFLSSYSLAAQIITLEDYLSNDTNNGSSKNYQLGLIDVASFLRGHGYSFESHEVTTEDGYILTLHRIPSGRNEPTNVKANTKPAVLIMHGYASSSVDFFILGPEHSIALMLADQGYDVWLGNNRGNTWSRKHQTLNPDTDDTFWDFSFHELGLYDDPAIIDYILTATGGDKISYIGHSIGNTQFFVLTSMKPEYNEKITVMAALGPSAYAKNIPHPVVQIAKEYYPLFELALEILNFNEILPYINSIQMDLQWLCSDNSDFQEVCAIVFFLIFGLDSDQLNRSIIPTMLETIPAGGSAKEIKHILQEIKSGHFRQFDYGVIKNLDIYNQSPPPDYNISLITAPVVLYYGKNDWWVGTDDVDRLASELPNLVEKNLIEYENFNYIDFIIARDIVSILYYDLTDMLNAHNGIDPITTTTSNGTTATTSISTTISDQTTTPSAGFSSRNLKEFLCISTGLIIIQLIV